MALTQIDPRDIRIGDTISMWAHGEHRTAESVEITEHFVNVYVGGNTTYAFDIDRAPFGPNGAAYRLEAGPTICHGCAIVFANGDTSALEAGSAVIARVFAYVEKSGLVTVDDTGDSGADEFLCACCLVWQPDHSGMYRLEPVPAAANDTARRWDDALEYALHYGARLRVAARFASLALTSAGANYYAHKGN